jgi:hypothetical protein
MFFLKLLSLASTENLSEEQENCSFAQPLSLSLSSSSSVNDEV